MNENCIHMTRNAGILSWCLIKDTYCDLNEPCSDYARGDVRKCQHQNTFQ